MSKAEELQYESLYEEILRRIEEYEGWDSQGGLKRKPNSPPFQWKADPAIYVFGKCIEEKVPAFKRKLANPIFLYLQGAEFLCIELPKRIQTLTQCVYDQRAAGHFQKAREGIEGIRTLLKEVGARGDRTRRMLADLEEVDGLVHDKLYHEVESREKTEEEGDAPEGLSRKDVIGGLSRKDAQVALIRALGIIIATYTKSYLTRDEQAQHIAGLLSLFNLKPSRKRKKPERQNDWDEEAIRRILAPARQSPIPKDASELYAKILVGEKIGTNRSKRQKK